jgi:hypothetical protein
MAELHLKTNEPKFAIEYSLKAIALAEKLNTPIKLLDAHLLISKAHELTNQIDKAYEHLKIYNKHKDEVHNQEVIRKLEQMSTQHKIDSSEKEKEIFRIKNVELKLALDEIHDSFKYASRIQNSLITSEKYIHNALQRLKLTLK